MKIRGILTNDIFVKIPLISFGLELELESPPFCSCANAPVCMTIIGQLYSSQI